MANIKDLGTKSELGNITPYGMYYELLKCHNPCPIDEDAREALKDEEYREKLTAYGEKIEELTKDI